MCAQVRADQQLGPTWFLRTLMAPRRVPRLWHAVTAGGAACLRCPPGQRQPSQQAVGGGGRLHRRGARYSPRALRPDQLGTCLRTLHECMSADLVVFLRVHTQAHQGPKTTSGEHRCAPGSVQSAASCPRMFLMLAGGTATAAAGGIVCGQGARV